MTKALDAAIRAAHDKMQEHPYARCFEGQNGPCYETDGCGCADAFARAVLRAALPAEPTPEAIEAMALAGAKTPGMAAIDSALTIAAIHGCILPKEYGEPGNSPMSIAVHAAYRALRANLLGEDA